MWIFHLDYIAKNTRSSICFKICFSGKVVYVLFNRTGQLTETAAEFSKILMLTWHELCPYVQSNCTLKVFHIQNKHKELHQTLQIPRNSIHTLGQVHCLTVIHETIQHTQQLSSCIFIISGMQVAIQCVQEVPGTGIASRKLIKVCTATARSWHCTWGNV